MGLLPLVGVLFDIIASTLLGKRLTEMPLDNQLSPALTIDYSTYSLFGRVLSNLLPIWAFLLR